MMSRESAFIVLALLCIGGFASAQTQFEREALWFNGPVGDVLSFDIGEHSMCVVAGADTRSSSPQADATCDITTDNSALSGSGSIAPSVTSVWAVTVENMSCKAECSEITEDGTELAFFYTGELGESSDGESALYNFSIEDYAMQGRVTCLLVALEFPADTPGRRVCEFKQVESNVQLTVDNAVCEWICLDEGLS